VDVVVKKPDHILSDGGNGPQQVQQRVSQCMDKITYFLMMEQGQKRSAVGLW
jgi:hypothetical protein